MDVESIQKVLTHISVDDQDTIAKTFFNETYGFPGIAVMFSRAFCDWKIRSQWTPEYLAAHLTEKNKLECLTGDRQPKYMTLEEYMQFGSSQFYFKTSAHLNTCLAKEYQVPECFNCWYAGTKIGQPKSRLSWLYIGLKDSFSRLHRDIWWTSAWNYLISGKKLWLIYPITYSQFIGAHKDAFSFNSFPNNNATPYQHIRPLVGIQQSGDMIFVPGTCYHEVINLEDSISLTENFMNETNYENVRSYFKQSANSKNVTDIELIIKEGFDHIRSEEQNLSAYEI